LIRTPVKGRSVMTTDTNSKSIPETDEQKTDDQKPHGGQFPPGRSGNPCGRPRGARNKLREEMLDRHELEWEPILCKLIDKATKGDVGALRLCFGRLLPQRRSQPVEFDLPLIETVEDARRASAAVLAALADGRLTPTEAKEIMALILDHLRIIESSTLEARLSAVEKQLKS
jgi:hypothetical protein